MTLRPIYRLSLASAVWVAALAAPSSAQIIANGGFESGLAGWTTNNQLGSDGTFLSQTGTLSPVNGFTVPAPPEGTRAAMTDAGAGGTHVLYQDFVVPNNVTSASVAFSLYLNNAAEAYFNPGNLDWAATNQAGGQILNQQARVDLMPAAVDPFSVAAADVLQNLFQTTGQTPLVTGYNPFSFDITALLQTHAGQTLRLRFAEVDNINFFNLGVDNVSVTAVPEPATCLIALGAMGVAWHARRRQ